MNQLTSIFNIILFIHKRVFFLVFLIKKTCTGTSSGVNEWPKILFKVFFFAYSSKTNIEACRVIRRRKTVTVL